LDQKLILLTCGTHGHILRLIPPLNMTDEDADKGMDIIEKAVAAIK
jgi:4-aminobutyrate aminotransferase-like enzyme